jgi:hypothetical protein
VTKVSIPGGLRYPWTGANPTSTINNIATPMTATGHKIAMIGSCYIEGRAASKTLNSSGSISFFPITGTVFTNAGSTLKVGIQDVDLVTGFTARPDGTYDVEATLTGGAGVLVPGTWKTVPMTTNSKTITHGQSIAVTFEFTKGGSDTVALGGVANTGNFGSVPPGWPVGAEFQVAWDYGNSMPNCMITFSDGTLGTIDFTFPAIASSEETYGGGSTPNDRGLIFQVPWDCKIDAFHATIVPNALTADSLWDIYSAPLSGSPTSLTGGGFTIPAERGGGVALAPRTVMFPSEITLTKDTDYCFSIKMLDVGTLDLGFLTLANENYRKFYAGGLTCRKGTRTGTGAFTAESPAITFYRMAVRISAFEDSAGGGGGSGAMLSRIQGGF